MEAESYVRFVLALVFVLALIGVFAWLARRMGFGIPVQGMRRQQSRRLGMVEVMALDGRRRLVLVRRDAVEHLLLLGPAGETVVETGITAGDGSRFADALAESGGGAPPPTAPPSSGDHR